MFHRRLMRFASPLCSLVCAIFLTLDAGAAIGIEESAPAADRPAVAQSEFSEGNARTYEKARSFRLQEQRRAKMKSQVQGIAMIVAPVVLIVLVTFLYARSRSEKTRKRSTHRKLKHAEAKRRSGPDQVLDPRQW